MNDDTFNMSIRKFLKHVGVHSQRELEAAVTRALEEGRLKGNESFPVKMRLTAGDVNLDVTFDDRIDLE
jgi:ribosomal protein L1